MTMFALVRRRQPVAQAEVVAVLPEPAPQLQPASEPAPTSAVVIPFPNARVPQGLVEADKRSSYEQVARQLGFAPAELVRAQLLEFFKKGGIELYDYAQVCAWLTEKKKQTGASEWCWRPLRAEDIIPDFEWGRGRGGDFGDGFYTSGNGSLAKPEWGSGRKNLCPPYDRLVPLPVLERVARVQEKFGTKVRFFVSDYPARNPDPFIMVRPATRNSGPADEYNLVFDAWDEPGFGV